MNILKKKVYTCVEQVDMDTLKILRDNFDVLYDGEKLGIFSDKKAGYQKIIDKEVVRKIIDNYYVKKLESDEIKYSYTKNLKNGRRFSHDTSLQGISRKIRHTISWQIYHDIDIKNAHPTFVLDFCQKNNLNCDGIRTYIENRDKCLEEIMDVVILGRDEAKNIPLAIINGGKRVHHFPVKNDVPKFIVQMEEEMKHVFDFYVRTPTGKKHYKRAEQVKTRDDGRTPYNVNGSAFNYFLCETENYVLSEMIEFCEKQKVRIGALCFDGLMLYSDDISNISDFLVKLNRHVRDKTKFKLDIVEKKMDEVIDIEGLEPKEVLCTEDSTLALAMYKILENSIKYSQTSKTLYIYDEKTSLWKPREFLVLRNLIDVSLKSYIDRACEALVKEDAVKLRKSILTTRKRDNIIREILPLVKESDNSDFITENFDRKCGIFPIDGNMTVDLRAGFVRKRVKEDYFTKTTERKFLENPDTNFVKEYFGQVLDTNDWKYIEYIINTLGYCLTGENNLKNFYILKGPQHTGKSLFIKILRGISGNFSCVANKRVFRSKGSESVHDTEIYSLVGKRISAVTEMESTDFFREDLIKSISGGDSITIRKASSATNDSFCLQTILWLATNEVPDFREPAFIGRLKVFDFHKEFSINKNRENEVLSKLDDFFTIAVQGAVNYYKNDMNIPVVSQVKISTDDVVREKDSLVEWCESQSDYRFETEAETKPKNNDGKIEYDFKHIKSEIFGKYLNWCKENFQRSIGRTTFYRRLSEKYYLKTDKIWFVRV